MSPEKARLEELKKRLASASLKDSAKQMWPIDFEKVGLSVQRDICCTHCTGHRQTGGWLLAGSSSRIYRCSENRQCVFMSLIFCFSVTRVRNTRPTEPACILQPLLKHPRFRPYPFRGWWREPNSAWAFWRAAQTWNSTVKKSCHCSTKTIKGCTADNLGFGKYCLYYL